MSMDPRAEISDLLRRTCDHASAYLAQADRGPVAHTVDSRALRGALAYDLTDGGVPASDVIDALVDAAGPGLVASTGGRFFGFVVGGSVPAALAADWLVSTWDQNVGFHVLSPTAALIESITAEWLLDLLGLPPDAAVGWVTGCQGANTMGLAAARYAVLQRVGWDVAADGLIGAPPLRVLAGEEAHGTIDRALNLLGVGTRRIERIAVDGQGRLCPESLEQRLAEDPSRPTIVCAQVGNVNTGACDPMEAISNACRAAGAWLHVDGAFGLWAAASPAHAHLVRGVEHADSWATDAHKWLNVPYDCGVTIVRDRAALQAATTYAGAYLVRSDGEHEPCAHTPESSRRARAVPVYAALRALGRQGVADLIERSCTHARAAADQLRARGAIILNDVVLNQVLVTFPPSAGIPGRDDPRHAARIDRIITAIQQDGTCWLGGTTWHGERAIRISVCNWQTTETDLTRSVDAILRAAAAVD